MAQATRPTLIDPHVLYLEQRWSKGCRNAAELARELARRGSDVRPRVVRAWETRRRRADADALDAGVSEAVGRWKAPTINRTAFLLQAERRALRQEDRAFIDRLLEKAPRLAAAANLADRLARLLRQQSSESLDDWFKDARCTALARLAAGLWRDLEAVRGAVTMPWSTSPVEGQISRLKMIKRQMYGRAGLICCVSGFSTPPNSRHHTGCGRTTVQTALTGPGRQGRNQPHRTTETVCSRGEGGSPSP
ncbi:transposase [Microvirga zambiensis]|uniref:transposase n=1 Tax=Microvirga zambiensis TaxID=1402137 RepID=UPI00191FF313|nr:transposase [Microvirga zambiensis]